MKSLCGSRDVLEVQRRPRAWPALFIRCACSSVEQRSMVHGKTGRYIDSNSHMSSCLGAQDAEATKKSKKKERKKKKGGAAVKDAASSGAEAEGDCSLETSGTPPIVLPTEREETGKAVDRAKAFAVKPSGVSAMPCSRKSVEDDFVAAMAAAHLGTAATSTALRFEGTPPPKVATVAKPAVVLNRRERRRRDGLDGGAPDASPAVVQAQKGSPETPARVPNGCNSSNASPTRKVLHRAATIVPSPLRTDAKQEGAHNPDVAAAAALHGRGPQKSVWQTGSRPSVAIKASSTYRDVRVSGSLPSSMVPAQLQNTSKNIQPSAASVADHRHQLRGTAEPVVLNKPTRAAAPASTYASIRQLNGQPPPPPPPPRVPVLPVGPHTMGGMQTAGGVASSGRSIMPAGAASMRHVSSGASTSLPNQRMAPLPRPQLESPTHAVPRAVASPGAGVAAVPCGWSNTSQAHSQRPQQQGVAAQSHEGQSGYGFQGRIPSPSPSPSLVFSVGSGPGALPGMASLFASKQIDWSFSGSHGSSGGGGSVGSRLWSGSGNGGSTGFPGMQQRGPREMVGGVRPLVGFAAPINGGPSRPTLQQPGHGRGLGGVPLTSVQCTGQGGSGVPAGARRQQHSLESLSSGLSSPASEKEAPYSHSLESAGLSHLRQLWAGDAPCAQGTSMHSLDSNTSYSSGMWGLPARPNGVMRVPEGSWGSVDPSFYCPLTRAVMKDPVRASDGITYERQVIYVKIVMCCEHKQ